MDQVLYEKAQSIERCLAQIAKYYKGHEEEFQTDFMRQDAIVLNLERACQQAIDMGNRMLRIRRLAIPKEAADVFRVLQSAELLSKELCDAMVAMTGFRNIAVHAYRELDIDKVQDIIDHHLDDLLAFSAAMLKADPGA